MTYLDRMIELAREASGEENPDVYRYLASESLGAPYSEVTPDQRTDAKRRFYHLLYSDHGREGALPAPVAAPTLEEVGELVAQFKAAYPDLGQRGWRPELQDLPKQRHTVLVVGANPFLVTRMLASCLVLEKDDRGFKDTLLVDMESYGEGPALEAFDFDSLEKAYEYMHRYVGREKVLGEAAPPTKMKGQAREPYWTKSWKGGRKR